MSEAAAGDKSGGTEHKANLFGLIYLLRQLGADVLSQGKIAEARALVDTLECLKVKTRGNLDKEETQFLDGVLTELRLAVVKGGSKGAESAGGEETTPGEGSAAPAGGAQAASERRAGEESSEDEDAGQTPKREEGP